MITEVAGIAVKVTKKRVRSLRLYVKPPDGRVEVTAPYLMPDILIRQFIGSKAGWIRSKQELIKAKSWPSDMRYVSGEAFYLWGTEYRLAVKYGSRYSLVISGGDAVFTVPEKSTAKQREARVNEWYRERLKEQIELRLPKWVARTGLRPSSWQVKNMKTRWGSCNTQTGKIWISLQLAKKPVECLDYVLLHELAHLRVPNHGKSFTAIMDRYMPDWKQMRKKLNGPDRMGDKE